MSRRSPWVIFAVALFVRLVYIAEIRSLPWFDVPIVDGANYLRTARLIASGHWLGGPAAFWQPPLYPYFLAVILRLFGERMIVVAFLQAALGSASCVLLHAIGRRLFDERAAIAAGLMMALYAPLIHFDAQPLIPVLHTFLALLGLLLLLRAGGAPPAPSGGRGPAAWSAAGFAWGLAAVATPNILFVVLPVTVWVWRRAASAGAPAGPPGGPPAGWRRLAPIALFLAGVALPPACAGARNLLVAGEPILISSNGGINFFIGNNADYDRTIRIRPGGEFERLAQEAENAGVAGAAARSRWFARRALDYLARYPASAARLYARKACDLVAGREIPRNESMYDYRRPSRLLAMLLWRKVLSFPFGLIAPLALAGWAAGLGSNQDDDARRAGLHLLLLYAAAYAISILLFFPTDRYRLPLVPVLALFAGRLVASRREVFKRREVMAALLAGFVLFNLDAFAATESWPEEEALNRAYVLRARGRLDDAKREYQRAIDLNPGRVDPYNALASMAAEAGDWEGAVWRYRELVAIAPDFLEVRCALGQALAALGRKEEARREWQTAAYLAPAAGEALALLSLSYLEDGLLEPASDAARRAVTARPDLSETHFALGATARALKRRDEALRELALAKRLAAEGTPEKRRASDLLEKMERREGAPGNAR